MRENKLSRTNGTKALLVMVKTSSYRITLLDVIMLRPFVSYLRLLVAALQLSLIWPTEKQKMQETRPKPTPIPLSTVATRMSKHSAWASGTEPRPDREFLDLLGIVKFYKGHSNNGTFITVHLSQKPRFEMSVLKKKMLDKRMCDITRDSHCASLASKSVLMGFTMLWHLYSMVVKRLLPLET